MKKISIVVPVYNEVDNLESLFKEISETVSSFDDSEVIVVDDGSNDGSIDVLKNEAAKNEKVKIILFSRNFGQTAALSAGFKYSSGDIIVPMDADLQNDPNDIKKLVNKLEEGYDIVSGWRKDRKDKLISRKIPSWIANRIISKVTKVSIHDYGCTIKAYRREILEKVNLYGEMHRFIPALAAWQGAKIIEMPVNHRERKAGKTKYGIMRTFKVLLDLLTVKFLTGYSTKPMHFFGTIGFYSLFFSIISGILAFYLRYIYHISFIETPLPLLTVFFILIGFQFILMGLLAEMITRTYYESQDKPTYFIKNKINF